MTEFKIGDKVVVIIGPTGCEYSHCFEVGDIGIVYGMDSDPGAPGVEVVVNGIVQWMHPSELELVNE